MSTKLQKAVLDAAAQANTSQGWRLLQAVGPMAAVVSLPLGLVMSLAGTVGEAYAKDSNLSGERMPDEWLGEVAASPSVSKEGLAHLARSLAKNGFVSVSDAVDWLAIEEEQSKRLRLQEQQKRPGAQLLLERAGRECAELLEPGLIDRAASALKTMVKFAPDVISVVSKFVKK